MTKIGQAGGDKIEPVLLVHDSAGFPFGLDADGSLFPIRIGEIGESNQHVAGLVVFASLETATAASLTVLAAANSAAVVIADDWGGHDHALRNFTLLFVRYRLLNAGFTSVTFLVTGEEVPPEGWHGNLKVIQTPLPLPPLSQRSDIAQRAACMCLLIDDAATAHDTIAWADRLKRDHGYTVRVIASPDCREAIELPVTLHDIAEPENVWGWLGPRIDLIAAHGFPGWMRRFAVLARHAGAHTVDLTQPGARARAEHLLIEGRPATTPSRADLPLAEWFRDLTGQEAGKP